jgi:SulP family sulfate permease
VSELLAEHIVAYRFDGPLFFAAAHRFLPELSEIADVRVVILRMSRISTLDATGAQVLGDAVTRLEQRGITVLLSGIGPGHDQVLTALGVAGHLRHDGLVFPDTPPRSPTPALVTTQPSQQAGRLSSPFRAGLLRTVAGCTG